MHSTDAATRTALHFRNRSDIADKSEGTNCLLLRAGATAAGLLLLARGLLGGHARRFQIAAEFRQALIVRIDLT